MENVDEIVGGAATRKDHYAAIERHLQDNKRREQRRHSVLRRPVKINGGCLDGLIPVSNCLI